MGERGNSVTQPAVTVEPATRAATEAAALDERPVSEPEFREIEREIVTVRSELAELLGELDRRRHELTDIRLQARRHPLALAIVGLACLVMGGSLTRWMYLRMQPDSPAVRARKLGRALALASKDPDRLLQALERRPDPQVKLLSALLALGTTAGRRVVARAL